MTRCSSPSRPRLSTCLRSATAATPSGHRPSERITRSFEGWVQRLGRKMFMTWELNAGKPRLVANDPTGGGRMENSLYERLGGVDAITAVVRAFEDRAGKDDRIKQKFARTDLARLTKEFVDQLCEATGGPCTYTGRNMTETHADMGVTNGEFDAFMGRPRREAGRVQGRRSGAG